jgi:hypothetical protein
MIKRINRITENLFEWIMDHPLIGIPLLTATPIVILVSLLTWFHYSLGVKGFGPESIQQVTIQRLYVDGGSSSHYMVGTDQGVLEVDNILWPVQVFNCDELYSKLEVGKTYTVKVKGNKVINWFVQEYPYIIEIQK